MSYIQKYQGETVKDGKPVRGYAARSTETGKVFILVPAKGQGSSFHCVEVKEESVVPLL